MFKLTIEEAQVALNWYNAFFDRNEPTKKDKNLVKSLKTFLNEDLTQEQTEEEA